MQLTHYNSPNNHDVLFGSMGHAKSSKWFGVGLAYPSDQNMALEAIHRVRVTTTKDTHTLTIKIINHKYWTPQELPITKHANIHTILTILPHTISYNPILEWPKYYQYIEPSFTFRICIHNQSNTTNNIQTPQALHHIIKRIHNSQVDT